MANARAVNLKREPIVIPIYQVLRDLRTPHPKINARELTPDCPVSWSFKTIELHGGKQEGVELIVVDNGSLRFTVIPTRGMGIHSMELGDIRLGWDSPVREVVHPAFVNLEARGGTGWLDGFTEYLCRCGLEFNGHPGPDSFIDFTGKPRTMDLTLHGRIANTPASEVEFVVDRDKPYGISVRGCVHERSFSGPLLELRTEISTLPGEKRLKITDVITNHSSKAQEFELFYHCNYGRPLLEAGARFVAPIQEVTPMNDRAAQGISGFAIYEDPSPNFIEQVYCMRLYGDLRDQSVVMLRNRAGDRGISKRFSLHDLPYFTIWKNTRPESDGYVTALEPGVNFPYPRRIERKLGRVPLLGPGQSRRFTLEIEVLQDAKQVQAVQKEIANIQGDRATVTHSRPLELDL